MYFKDYMKMMRDRDKITQAQLANALNVSLNTIKKIESGSTKIPNSKLLNAIAEYENAHPCKVLSRILFGDIVGDTDERSKKAMRVTFAYFSYMYLEGWNIDHVFNVEYVDDIGDRQFIGEISKKKDSKYVLLIDYIDRYQLDTRYIDWREYQIGFFTQIFTTMISIDKKYMGMNILFDANDEKEVTIFNALKSFDTDRVKTQITYILFDDVEYKIKDIHLVTK
ncbi:helix-turn-helix domain-containing protein [Longibaculum muris]|uniref:helix-turn-helix domain-containing protein n=1 Tax=Longibaculum muris TaxID=1796628 RepID=UPI003AB11244